MKLQFERCMRVPRVPGWGVVLFAAWLSIVASLALLSRAQPAPVITCHFRTVTGWPCATCGSTRAGLSIFKGRPLEALALNPLVVIAGAVVVVVLGVRLATAHQVTLVASRKERLILTGLAGGVFIANWAYVLVRHAADSGLH